MTKERPIIKECYADECEGNHEGCCIMGEIYKGFDPWSCTAKTNADLVPGCERCELNPADAKFPWEEYCTICAKEVEREWEEDEYYCNMENFLPVDMSFLGDKNERKR